MRRTCTICTHPERANIDRLLIAGGSLRDIAGQFRLSKTALERHKNNDLPATLVRVRGATYMAGADALLSQAQELQQRTIRLLDKAEKAGELRTALADIVAARGNLELLGKLHETGDLEPRLSELEASLTARPQERGKAMAGIAKRWSGWRKPSNRSCRTSGYSPLRRRKKPMLSSRQRKNATTPYPRTPR